MEHWLEAFRTLARHRTRSAVTALSMSWGLFMLVVLLGAATGLRQGTEFVFRDDATNSLWIHPGTTVLPHRGQPRGTPVTFDMDDIDAIVHGIAATREITGRFHIDGHFSVTRDQEQAFFSVRATHPDHQVLERTIVTTGRFLNAIDLAKRRKVAVIGRDVVDRLFGQEDPLGQTIAIGHVHYHVVGTFDDEGGEGERRMIYIPITTAQLVYNGGRRVDRIMFTIPNAYGLEESRRVEHELRHLLAGRHRFDPDDPGAVYIDNRIEDAMRIRDVLTGIEVFTWIVGLGTIVAGVVGVGNIMLISVAERTREFGIRRALGATPTSVVAMVLREALVLTVVAGYGGLLLGIAALELGGPMLPEHDLFRDPQAEPTTVMLATLVLIASGLLAGFVPARRAMALTPSEALRA